jgi:ceramide glucosyltransferase
LLSGHALLGVVWLVATVLNRLLQAGAILQVLGDENWMHGMLLYPLRDLLGCVLWLGSYGGDKFYYRGKFYTLKGGGRVEEPQ